MYYSFALRCTLFPSEAPLYRKYQNKQSKLFLSTPNFLDVEINVASIKPSLAFKSDKEIRLL